MTSLGRPVIAKATVGDVEAVARSLEAMIGDGVNGGVA